MNSGWLFVRTAVSKAAADAAMAQLVPLAADGGFRIYLVGGSVRDRLMGGQAKDLDIVVVHPDYGLEAPKALAELAKARLGAHGGALTNQGTIVVRIGDVELDLAAPRAETYTEGSRKPEVAAASIEEDARRRDFTINALYEDLHNPSPKLEDRIVDPTGSGLSDLKNRVLRSPNPEQTFLEDPLRMMRAVRFKAKTGFELDHETDKRLREALPRFKESLGTQKMSWERARTELEKLLGGPNPGETMRIMTELGLTTSVIPEWEAMVGLKHETPHHLEDVDDHSYRVLDEVARLADGDIGLLLAGLLHDIAKPQTKQMVAEKMHAVFHAHDIEGVPLVRAILERLRFPTDIIDRVAKLVEHHLRPHMLSGGKDVSDKAVRRFIRDMGDDLKAVIDLSEADIRGREAQEPGSKERDLGSLSKFRERVERLQQEMPAQPLSEMKPLLDGNELQQMFGRPPGKWIGDAQKYLIDLQLGDPTMTKEQAAEKVRAWLGAAPPAGQGELTQNSHPVVEGDGGGMPPQKTASKRGHGVVSSFMEGLTEEQNMARLEQLKKRVLELGYKFEVMDGSWRGVPEKSLLIKDIPEDVMAGLANEFSQEAFATSASGAASPWIRTAQDDDKESSDDKPHEPGQKSPQESGDEPQPETPPPGAATPPPGQQVPPSAESVPPASPEPRSSSPHAPVPISEADLLSIREHPVFVKAYSDARPVLEKYAKELGIDPNDPMSAIPVHQYIHDGKMQSTSIEADPSPEAAKKRLQETRDKLLKIQKDREEGRISEEQFREIQTEMLGGSVDMGKIARLHIIVNGQGVSMFRGASGVDATYTDYLDWLQKGSRSASLNTAAAALRKGTAGIRLWLDDKRPIPEGYDVWAKTAQEAIAVLSTGNVTHVSLDHDLGDEPGNNGYEVAKFVEQGAHDGTLKPMTWSLHTANPSGGGNMKLAMEQADKFWQKHKSQDEGQDRAAGHQLRIGSSGFGHADWLGSFYPNGTHQRDRMAHYAKHFSAVEITSTRHSVPPTRVLEHWAESTPAGFVFSVCAPSAVRPGNMSTGGAALMRSFMRRLHSTLGKKLGPIVLTIPAYETFSTGQARSFFDQLPRHERYAVQVESQEWMNQEVLDELLARRIAIVDTEFGHAATDIIGWGYKRLRAAMAPYLSRLALGSTSLVFIEDKSNNFPSKELLQALRDLGVKLGPEGLTKLPHHGPSDPSTGPANSALPSSSYDDERGQPLTVVKPTEKDDELDYFGKKQPLAPPAQYPDLDANDGASDPFTGMVDKDTRRP